MGDRRASPPLGGPAMTRLGSAAPSRADPAPCARGGRASPINRRCARGRAGDCGAVRFAISGPGVAGAGVLPRLPADRGRCRNRSCGSRPMRGPGPQGRPRHDRRPDQRDAVTRPLCPDGGTHLMTPRPGRDDRIAKIGTLHDPAVAARPSIAFVTAEAARHHVIPDHRRAVPGSPPVGQARAGASAAGKPCARSWRHPPRPRAITACSAAPA